MLANVPQAHRPPRQAKPGTAPGSGGSINGKGQPPFIATAEQRARVRRLVACGFTNDSISVIIEIPLATLERHFKHELTHGKLLTDSRILEGIALQALEGDKTMSIFWARARAGWKHAGEGQESAAAAAFTINITNGANGDALPDDTHTITIEARPEEEP